MNRSASSTSMRRGRKAGGATGRVRFVAGDEKTGGGGSSRSRGCLLLQIAVSLALLLALGLRLFVVGGRAALMRRAAALGKSIHLRGMSSRGSSMIVCDDAFVTVVLPSVVNPRGRTSRLKAIAATWGREARAVFVSHEEEERKPQVGKQSEENLMPFDGAALCDHEKWPRSLVVPKSINPATMGVARLFWILQALGNQTDSIKFSFFVNDHTAIIARNLRCFLRSLPSEKALYLGHSLANRGGGNDIFNSGAAGYVLSRASIKLLIRLGKEEQHPACTAAKNNKWLQGNPGLVIARCLASHGILPLDTREIHPSGARHRFHAYGPVRTAIGAVDEWYERMHENLPLDPPASIFPAPDCCARRTVSFHYVEAHEQYIIHATLQEAAPRFRDSILQGSTAITPTNTNKGGLIDTTAWLKANWPPAAKLGGYSQPFPYMKPEAASQVEQLLFEHIEIAEASDVCDDHLSWRLLRNMSSVGFAF